MAPKSRQLSHSHKDSSKTVKFVIHFAENSFQLCLTLPTLIFIFCFTGQCNEDTQFTCSSGERQCIPIDFAQDGDEDCSDGSDEYSTLRGSLKGPFNSYVDKMSGE